MKKLGLIGYPLGHSFSKKYYLAKFADESIKDIDYDLYPLEHISEFPKLYENDPDFYGFNVTIPYKREVIVYMDELSPEAEQMQAVNCIQVRRDQGKPYLKGFNTDAFGFEHSLRPLLKSEHRQALVLGNGGAAQAVYYALDQLKIPFKIVSRSKDKGDLTYTELTKETVAAFPILINCSPVGTFPRVEESPEIPYDGITSQHLLYDLIYNPEETLFLKEGKARGATTKNGYEMLTLQAEKNWEIWNEPNGTF
ncbi:shikimate dehydrogenase [Sphingobacterium allocomposti]|jgi:shikimate dehydrogenase|uniref:Shikimate dehydrogenase n=1 Tax=Sphingobacterium allocomposti TaxID=415956 RepID=A0A5S5D9F8_9SPHI|nr:shikimate dehydrogenase [Sphingobacterium composti Yoo et al. 2007 non Ten et al. 2007]TYP91219.1 shikimate dehydrogenase [Sphingobacterium composti Yoo et al. 2007 non Ten et al. 2007]HLS94038.1 shikimate dehydrogenase [Sphingobacterium sp.]